MNATTISSASYHNASFCPHASDEDIQELAKLHFIIEGVAQCLVSCLGVLGNTCRLGRELRSSFAKLLAILAVFDLIYLITMLLDSMSKVGLSSDLHILMFPHFFNPLNSISMMRSIYIST